MCAVCLGFWGVPCVGALLRVLFSTCASVGVSSPDAAVASRSAELLRLTGFERYLESSARNSESREEGHTTRVHGDRFRDHSVQSICKHDATERERAKRERDGDAAQGVRAPAHPTGMTPKNNFAPSGNRTPVLRVLQTRALSWEAKILPLNQERFQHLRHGGGRVIIPKPHSPRHF